MKLALINGRKSKFPVENETPLLWIGMRIGERLTFLSSSASLFQYEQSEPVATNPGIIIPL